MENESSFSFWTGIAYKLPRNMIKESEKRNELASPGVYFLFGYDDTKSDAQTQNR